MNDHSYEPVPVKVIASFSTRGIMKPIYVELGGETKRISSSAERNYSLVDVFTCELDDPRARNKLELTYHKMERYWSISPDSEYATND